MLSTQQMTGSLLPLSYYLEVSSTVFFSSSYLFTGTFFLSSCNLVKLRSISQPRGEPKQQCCLNKGVGAGQAVEHMVAFGLPLCVGLGQRLLHTAPCEQHHKSAG